MPRKNPPAAAACLPSVGQAKEGPSFDSLTRLANTAGRLERRLQETIDQTIGDPFENLEVAQLGFLLNGLVWSAYHFLEPDAFDLFLVGSQISRADAEACIAVVNFTIAP